MNKNTAAKKIRNLLDDVADKAGELKNVYAETQDNDFYGMSLDEILDLGSVVINTENPNGKRGAFVTIGPQHICERLTKDLIDIQPEGSDMKKVIR